MTPVVLDAEIIEGFQKAFLLDQFDNPSPTPPFHRTMWADACSKAVKCAWAAPRNHAKSTAITLTYVLAAIMFRVRDYALIISDTEGQAVKFLGDLKMQLIENAKLRSVFGIVALSKDTEAEVVVQFADGHLANITAKGSEQKVRGLKWRNKRPNLVVVDDCENDEIVMNADRRKKFKSWFTNALLQCGSKNALYRVVGTILHHDSMLQGLVNRKSGWLTRVWRAHAAFDDFSDILWPERFTAEELRVNRQEFIDDPDGAGRDGYSQEYLNEPSSPDNDYYRKTDFRPLPDDLEETAMLYYVASDWAASKRYKRADHTCHVVAGVRPDNRVCIVKVIHGRFDSLENVNILFDLNEEFAPEAFIAEKGTIEKTVGPFLDVEMITRNTYLIMDTVASNVKLELRAKAFQGRMRAGGVSWDTDAPWFQDCQRQHLQFPRGAKDDYVAATAVLGQYLARLARPLTEEEDEEEDLEDGRSRVTSGKGRSKVTGY